jgi:tetratricopeptide (TPR) repeat protein
VSVYICYLIVICVAQFDDCILSVTNRFVEAVANCDEALILDKNMVKLHVRRGRALLRLGQFPAAEEAFRRVLAFHARDLLTPREALSDDLLQETVDVLEGNKNNARLGLKDLEKLRELNKNLVLFEGQMKHKEALRAADDMLKLAPYLRTAQIAKAKGMCELQLYDEAKQYMEDLTAQTHETIQVTFAHPSATLPWKQAPGVLQWKENSAEKCIRVDLPAVVAFLLCLGPAMSAVYVLALKNLNANRQFSTDIMNKVATLLKGLAARLTFPDISDKWSWVASENDKIQCLLNLKTNGDEKFKAQNFKGAVMAYSNAVKVSKHEPLV